MCVLRDFNAKVGDDTGNIPSVIGGLVSVTGMETPPYWSILLSNNDFWSVERYFPIRTFTDTFRCPQTTETKIRLIIFFGVKLGKELTRVPGHNLQPLLWRLVSTQKPCYIIYRLFWIEWLHQNFYLMHLGTIQRTCVCVGGGGSCPLVTLILIKGTRSSDHQSNELFLALYYHNFYKSLIWPRA